MAGAKHTAVSAESAAGLKNKFPGNAGSRFAISARRIKFNPLSNDFSIAAYWSDGLDESGLADWAKRLRSRLLAPEVSLGLVFLSPKFFPDAKMVLEILRLHAQIPLLVGCSSSSLIAGAEELEAAGGLVLALYALPGAKLKAVRFTQEQLAEAGDENFWPVECGVMAQNVNGWLAFVDPFHLDAEGWLRSWNKSYPSQPVYGGLAAGDFPEPLTQLYLDGEVFEDGGVALAVGGDVALAGVISQGCTPIGEAWTLTRVEKNFIQHIGNRPAYTVLSETVQQLPAAEQVKARGNLFIGLVVNEYLEDFHRGDFLVRNLLGGDPSSGVIAVSAMPRAGQTIVSAARRRRCLRRHERTPRPHEKKSRRHGGLRRLPLLLQRPRPEFVWPAQPRCRTGAGAFRPGRPRRFFWQRRNRPGR